ncbi:MAG: hypothetical protein NTZ65_00310 [Candidatus Berkelbacteria bacterium]|nr:hypothetical protein [Candidatus Berkelbacteria bacterium]
MRKKILFISSAILVCLPSIVLATYESPQGDISDLNPVVGGGDVYSLMTSIINRLPIWLGGFAFLALLYSGFIYLTSFGDATKMESAKKNLTWTVTGIIGVFSVFAIMKLIILITNSGKIQ